MSRAPAAPSSWSTLRRLWGQTRPYARRRNVLFVLVSIRALQLPFITWAIGWVISGPIAAHDRAGTWLGVIGLGVLIAVTELSFVYRVVLALELGEVVVRDLRQALFRHLLGMPLAFFQRTPVGALVSRLVADIDAVRLGVQEVAFVGIVQLGTMLVAAALMLAYDWALFLVVALTVPLLWALLAHFQKRLSQALREVQESFSRVTSALAEAVSGIREIQGFARQDVNGGLFRALIEDHSRYNMNVARQSASVLPLLEFNGQLFIAILIALGGYRAHAGTLELATLIQFFFLSNVFFNPLPILGNLYNQALSALAGAERVYQLLDTEPSLTDPPGARPMHELAGAVEFRDVGFEYEPGHPVLHDVSFSVRPGELVALVGASGGGKSTLLGLLGKLYLASRGEISIDGRPIREISAESLHRRMAIVPQNCFLFSGTVSSNIRFGRPDATDAEVREAVHALGVLDLIEQLPSGFDTPVGERGQALSLGQRQIVCFARALIARPQIVLLDEATSAMDSVTEARVQAALRQLLAGRTSFVVAHRLSTIRSADQILVVERGRVVERGTHAELLRRGGAYAALHDWLGSDQTSVAERASVVV